MTKIPKRTARERRVLRDIIDTFNADILFAWRPPLPMLKHERAIKRNNIENRLIEQASDHGHDAVVPYWSKLSLDRPGRIAVVHAAPSKSDVGTGTLGGGVSAHRVRQTLNANGISPAHISELSTVFRYMDRMPTVDEMAADHSLLIDALDAADVDYVLLHGQHALHSWRPDLTLAQSVGKVGLWRERWWVMPIFHAESAFKGYGSITREEWAFHVRLFADLVQAPDPFRLVETHCIARNKDTICNDSAYAWDEDALPWCDKHWDKGRQGHLDAMKGPKKRDQLPGQLSLELNGEAI